MKRELAIAWALCVWAPPLSPAAADPVSSTTMAAAVAHAKDPVEDSGPEFATPTTLDRVGRIVAPVMINGYGPFRFIVDTGANRSLISTELAERLGFDHASAQRVVMNGVTGSASVPAVHIDEIKAGELVLKGLQVPVVPRRQIGDADGILGLAELREMRLVVDFSKDKVLISGRKLWLWDGGSMRITARRVAGGLLAADAKIKRVRVIAIMDTGGQVTLGNRALQEALRSAIREQAEVMGTTEAMVMGDTARIPDLEFGRVSIRRVRVAFGDFHIFDVWGLKDQPALIIGMDVLGAMDAFMIDFRRNEIHLRS